MLEVVHSLLEEKRGLQHKKTEESRSRSAGRPGIDFVVYGKDVFSAIEVKNTASVRPEDIRPLKIFGTDYPEAKRTLVYRGKEQLRRDGILIVPC